MPFWETTVQDKKIYTCESQDRATFFKCDDPKYLNKLQKIADRNPKITFSHYNREMLRLFREKRPISIAGGKFYLFDGGYPYPDQYLVPLDLRDEKIFHLDKYQDLINFIREFSHKKDFYTQRNLFYKAGIFLYGPPGNSKTTFIRYLLKNVIDPTAVVIWCNALPGVTLTQELRKISGLKVLIFEELTTTVSNEYAIKKFLEFTDGENSLNNCLIFATTNYPEQLSANVVDRKGRFDKMVRFDNPDTIQRREIILNYYPECNSIDDYVKATKDFSFADIRECYIQQDIYGVDFLTSCKQFKDHKQFVKDHFNKGTKIGGFE
jgi:hypothetical protein